MKKLFVLIMFLILVSLSTAQFNPHDDIILRYTYDIIQGVNADFNGTVNITGTLNINGSPVIVNNNIFDQVLNTSSDVTFDNVTATTGFFGDLTGNADTATLADDSTAWITMTSLQAKWLADVANVLTFDESELNDSIATALATTYYNLSSIDITTGNSEGAITLAHAHDEISWNISEVSSDLLFYVNWSDITIFNQILIYYRTETGEKDDVIVSLLNCNTSVWEGYKVLSNTDFAYVEVSFTVSDPEDHVCSGDVSLRFQTTNVGNRADKWNFDWITLSKGVSSAVGIELDPLSIHKLGDVQLTGNWDAGSFNITAQQIKAILNWSFLQNIPVYVKNYTSDIDAKASAGTADCTGSEVAQNITTNTSGVFSDCLAPTGSGTVTQIDTDDTYLSGGPITGSGTIALNETYALTNLNVNHSTTSGTATTWDGETSQANLNVNHSDTSGTTTVWASVTSFIAKWFYDNSNVLTFNETELNDSIESYGYSTTTGTVTNVNDGDGMTFTAISTTGDVTMGTPGTLTASTSNAVTANSHTHGVTTDSSGACAAGVICAGGFTIPASSVTTGTFGAGDYVFPDELTVTDNISVSGKINFVLGTNMCIFVNGTDLVIANNVDGVTC